MCSEGKEHSGKWDWSDDSALEHLVSVHCFQIVKDMHAYDGDVIARARVNLVCDKELDRLLALMPAKEDWYNYEDKFLYNFPIFLCLCTA